MSRKSAAASRLVATPRDGEIIRAVVRHGAMTRQQIARLCFLKPDGGLSSVQAACRRLSLLVQREYLTRYRLPVAQGSGQYVYLPGKHAKDVLSEDEQANYQPSSRRARSAASLQHGLEIVDLYLALREGLQRQGGAILTWLTEREAHYSFEGNGGSLRLTPDGYCLWSLAGEEGAFFLEWDRGTESLARLEQKMARYADYYLARAYRQHLGDMGLRPRILLVVPDRRREQRVARWMVSRREPGPWAALPTVLIGAERRVLGDILGCVWRAPGDDVLVRLTC